MSDHRVSASSKASAETFAKELRILRGNRKQAALARDARVSQATVSNAFNGKCLPTWPTTRALVQALGGDTKAWHARWEAAKAAQAEPSAGNEPPVDAGGEPLRPEPSSPVTKAPPTIRLSSAAIVAAVAAALAFSTAFVVARLTTPVRSPAAGATAKTGDDPMDTSCDDDAKEVGNDKVTGEYVLELFWSTKCHANWARLTRDDGKPNGNRLAVSLYGQFPGAPSALQAERADVNDLYTRIMVVTNEQTVCATGTIWIGAQAVTARHPVCR